MYAIIYIYEIIIPIIYYWHAFMFCTYIITDNWYTIIIYYLVYKNVLLLFGDSDV